MIIKPFDLQCAVGPETSSTQQSNNFVPMCSGGPTWFASISSGHITGDAVQITLQPQLPAQVHAVADIQGRFEP